MNIAEAMLSSFGALPPMRHVLRAAISNRWLRVPSGPHRSSAIRSVNDMAESGARVLELMKALGSADAQERIRALFEIQAEGIGLLPALLEIVGQPDATLVCLVWTMMSIGQFGSAATEPAHSALVCCLGATSPTVRRAAIRTLGQLRDLDAIPQIAALRTDHTQDPNAWFDDDCTVAQTAELVLAALQRSTR